MSKYSALLQWSEEDNAYIATVPELPGLSAFGSSQEEVAMELSIAMKAYLEVMEEDGEEIPEPELLKSFSGQTRLRLPKSLHQSLTSEAKREGVSLNTYVIQLLSQRNLVKKLELRITALEDSIYKSILSVYQPALLAEAEKSIIQITTINSGWQNEDSH